MSVTIREVARQAGVSIATVSRVLNSSGPVGVETRARVTRVASDLRFVPNGAARSLITSRTCTLGALLPDIFGEFFSEVLRGLDTAAQREGYQLLVSSSHHDRSGIVAALRAMRGRVDGLVVMAPDLDARLLRENLPSRLPVVLLNCLVEGSPYPALNIANVEGAGEAVAHLAALGHRRVAFVGGPPGNHDAAERLRGYRLGALAHGLDAGEGLEAFGDFSDVSGYHAARALFSGVPGERPTALFAANDAMAIGAIGALREAGLGVPEDVSVVGFDDIPMARYFSPPLTTVRAPLHALGSRGIETLLTADAGAAPVYAVLPTELVVRASSAARLS